MLRSLQARLVILVLLLIVAAVAAGGLMVGLFGQSTSARVNQAQAELHPACDSIYDAYRFYTTGAANPGVSPDPAFKRGLLTVVQSALARRVGIEGGIWQSTQGSMAYAYPSYEGGASKTDLPQAEAARIEQVNRRALSDEKRATARYVAPSETLLIAACPLPGPIPDLTAWVMTRVRPFAGRAYQQLMTGIAVLFIAVVIAAILLLQLTISWSRHVRRIEGALLVHDIADLPQLPLTGERELDQVVRALNDAGRRLAEARHRAEEMSLRVATSERLAAIGRVTAGVAHEIRNPIAAMRLKAENALATGGERYRDALTLILEQISRLDRLLQRLLTVTERERPQLTEVALAPLLLASADAERANATARAIRLEVNSTVPSAQLDADLMRRALDNLLSNAIQAAPANSRIELISAIRDQQLVLAVRDEGAGPPEHLRELIFEPFITGRPEGTGLGLSIVREVAEAHGGKAQLRITPQGTLFEILLPWPAS